MAQSVFAAYALECLARLAAATGDERRCRDHAAHAMTLIDKHHNELGRLYVHSALGLLELGLGRMEPAIQTLERARDLAELHGLAEPNVVHWQADLIEAYVRAGKPARRARGAGCARRSRRSAPVGRWALGTAARCRGLLADDPEQTPASPPPLEHLQAAAGALRDRAHPSLPRRAPATSRPAHRRPPGAAAGDRRIRSPRRPPWADRARAELRATGAKPRRRQSRADRDQLTAHELQVALIVANGASNREAAAALFLSPKTIEFHLAHIYRKLGVRTRTELAALAAQARVAGRPPRRREPRLGISPARTRRHDSIGVWRDARHINARSR